MNRKPYLCGFQKCGLNSIIKWYSDQGITDIHTTEDITSTNCIPTFLPFKDTHFPVVIIRNKVDAIWSIYWFFGYHKSHTLKEFLNIDEPSIQYGNNNPINRVDYSYHLKKFEGITDVQVYELEKMIDFPKKNTTKDMFEQYPDLQGYRKYSPDEKLIIEKAIDSYDRNNLKYKVRLI